MVLPSRLVDLMEKHRCYRPLFSLGIWFNESLGLPDHVSRVPRTTYTLMVCAEPVWCEDESDMMTVWEMYRDKKFHRDWEELYLEKAWSFGLLQQKWEV